MRCGDIVWCNLCGGWATSTARRLARPCVGRLVCKGVSGSRAHGLRALRRGRHPLTGDYIGQPCPEHAWPTVGPILRPLALRRIYGWDRVAPSDLRTLVLFELVVTNRACNR